MQNDNATWQTSEARWIHLEGYENEPNSYIQFVRPFTAEPDAELVIEITAINQYQLFVNGRFVGRGPAVSDVNRYYYHTCTVAAAKLKAGENLIAVLVHNEGPNTKTIQGFRYSPTGLLLRARQGSQTIVSDGTWKARRAPNYTAQNMVSQWGQFKEIYHGDKEDNWTRPGFDHADWANATAFADPVSTDYVRNLAALDVPPLEETSLKPSRIVDVANNLGRVEHDAPLPAEWTGEPIEFAPGEHGAVPSITLDFGTFVVGYPEIEVTGPFHIYEVWYGESLDLMRQDVIRAPRDGVWRAYQRRAFRYMQLRFIALEGPVSLRRVDFTNVWYAYNNDARTESSDALTNRMLEISRHTLRANTSYHYEDCPMREQALWVFDLRQMAQINYYNYGNPEAVAKSLRQMYAIQREDGSTASTGPKDNEMFHLDFCLHLTGTLHDYYRVTGDKALLEDLWPYVERLHQFIVVSSRAGDGLLDSTRHDRCRSVYLDWSTMIDKPGKSVILNAVYARYLREMALMAGELGRDGAAHLAEFERVRGRANELLYDADQGLYRDSWLDGQPSPKVSMQGNLAAMYGGFVKQDEIAPLLQRVLADERCPPPFGPSFYLLIADALGESGHVEQLLEMLMSYWTPMIERGAVTWWEVFDPTSPEWMYPHPFLGNCPTYEMEHVPISTCHGWSGTPGYAIPRYVMGVDLTDVYQGRVRVKPGLPGHYERFNYRVPVAGGALELEFVRNNGRYEIVLREQPAGIEVEIE